MKLQTISNPIITSDSFDTSTMSVAEESKDLITYFLRDKIYSNKILAVVRETVTNAIDEHVKFDVKKPVEIGIRQEGVDYQFYVRDYANGLSEHDVRNIFGMYGRSTKSKTNEATGMFGVGSKAPLSYTDSFNVISHHNGKKTTYVCSLGGGDNGVPVGQIFKLEEIDTDSSGIEIQVQIKKNDVYNFHQNIKIIQASALSPVIFNYCGTLIEKPEPVEQITKNGFLFRLMRREDFEGHLQLIVLTMGGVKYETFNYDSIKSVHTKQHHVLLVDIPIGAMSVPISREQFEKTPANDRYRGKIIETIKELHNEDAEIFRTKDLKTLVQESIDNSSVVSNCWQGKWFSHNIKSIYPDSWEFITNVRKVDRSSDLEKIKDKIVVYSIPDNKASDHWVAKVRTHCLINNVSALYVNEKHLPNAEEIAEFYKIVSARKIRIESQSEKKYSVYRNGSSLGQMNALEVHNFIRKTLQLPEATNLEQAKKQNKEFFDTVSDINKLREFLINPSQSYRYYSPTIKAKALLRDLEKIGVFPQSHKVAVSKMQLLLQAQSEQDKRNADIRNAQNLWINFSDRTQSLIKNHKNAQRILKYYNCIKQKNDLNKKFFAAMERNSYYSEKIARNDLRKFLLIK